MKPEYLIFKLVEGAFGHEAEIGHVFFVFYPPCLAVFFAADLFEAGLADMFFLGSTISKAPVTGAGNRSEDAIAGYVRPCAAALSQSESAALRAALFGQSEYFRGTPVKIHE